MKIGKDELAETIRARRTQKGLTQTELSEKTGISLRSIQRIEKGEVTPRSFTVNALAAVLEFRPEKMREVRSSETSGKAKKLILSIGSSLTLILFALAFLAQSRAFPETNFELYLFFAGVIILLAISQWFIWVSPIPAKQK